MKTNDELIDMLEHGAIVARDVPFFGKQNERDRICYALERGKLDALLDVCRRDAWEAGAKAQQTYLADAADAFVATVVNGRLSAWTIRHSQLAPFPENKEGK